MDKHSTTKKTTDSNSSSTAGHQGSASHQGGTAGSSAEHKGNDSGKAGDTGSRSHGATDTHKANQASRAKRQTPVEDSKLKEFFVDELKDIYWAEQKLVKTLPKLQKAATSAELKDAFGSHLKETEGHVERIEKAFSLIGEKAHAKKCEAMEGITEEGSSIIEDTEEGTATRDVGLVMAGQKAEHYEIATYGALIQIAQTLGFDEVADLFAQTLQEEKAADQKLTSIAENNINYTAAGEKA